MNAAILGACLALASFLAVNLLVSLAVAASWRAVVRYWGSAAPPSRARALCLMRLLPILVATTFVAGVFLPAFVRFEPAQTTESVTRSLGALAAAAAALMAIGVLRGLRASVATSRLVRDWSTRGTPVVLPGMELQAWSIPADFPVVSVVGILRPKLFISDRLLRECTGEELSAMVRHERAHVAYADNLKRMVFRVSPDALRLFDAGEELERRWEEASEETADDYSVRSGRDTSGERATPALALANALVRVARMAPADAPPLVPVTSLYRGSPVERRVRRLLGAPTLGSRPDARLLVLEAVTLVVPSLALAAFLNPSLARGVHAVIEAVVRGLP